MVEMGYDPSVTIGVTCDQGDDINATFVLPDGTAIDCDFREDEISGQAIRITQWHALPLEPDSENEFSLAAEILRDPHLKDAFDKAVTAFFEFHWRDDYALPGRS